MSRITDKTSTFYDLLFPTKERLDYKPDVDYDTNNVIKKDLIIFGDQGTAKTGAAIKIVEEACKLYGIDNVNALNCSGARGALVFEYGLDKKPIQILVFDDFTLTEVSKKKLRDFFRSRNIWHESTGISNGLMLKIFCTHRYHGLMVEFRTNLDVLLCKSLPINIYDFRALTHFMTEKGMDLLKQIDMGRMKDPKYNTFGVFKSKFDLGISILPIAQNNFVKNLRLPNKIEIALQIGAIKV